MTDRTTFNGSSTDVPWVNTGAVPEGFGDQYDRHIRTLYNAATLPLVAVGGTGDTISASLDPVLSSGLVDGMRFGITWANNNTGSATLSINGAAPVPILDAQGSTLAAGSLIVGYRSMLEFVSGSFRIVGDRGLNEQAVPYFTLITASTTWSKPPGYSDDTQVLVQVVGGGGGGAGGGSGGGGGGGGGAGEVRLRYADIPSSVAVAVAAGGAAGSGGGTTSFGSFLFGFGGGGASAAVGGGGGGGVHGSGVVINPGRVGGGGGGNGGGGASDAGGDATNIFGGGGGGMPGAGGYAVRGGGGGGGGGASNGGVSLSGGNGGASGMVGSAPGGGGGTNAAGARGEVKIWIGGSG